jgi:hypothetical protein
MFVMAVGCRPKQEKAVVAPAAGSNPHAGMPGMPGMGGPAMAKKESKVVVPSFQDGKWKALKLELTDLASKKVTTVSVPLTGDTALANTGLTIHVDAILCDFGMGEGVITSRSEKLNNPAAQVKITEGGKDVFKGWMFAKFPETHAFEHPKFGLKLVDFVPAK